MVSRCTAVRASSIHTLRRREGRAIFLIFPILHLVFLSFRLNHCVGGRNYVAFLMCVVSAVVAAMVMLTAVVTELVLYYMKSNWLIIWPTATQASTSAAIDNNNNNNNSEDFYPIQNDTIPSAIFNQTFIGVNDTFNGLDDIVNATESVLEAAAAAVGGISLHDTIFLAFISVLGILAAITVGLLLHLCFFHVYISFLGLTTYEYIRNQRQNAAQQSSEASANTSKTNSQLKMPDATLNALKKSSSTSAASTQLYFCSTIDPKNLIETHDANAKYRPKSLHCCDTSLQYQKTSHKAFYVCSMLHERTASALSHSRTFHCCSKYKQVIDLPPSRQSTNGGTNGINSLLMHDEPSPSVVQFSEQCTFCSFKLKPTHASPPIVHEPSLTHLHQEPLQMRNNDRFYDAKTLSKHHRWKRKWNCCSNVPDSPDIPPDGDVIRTVSSAIAAEQNEHANNNRQLRHHRHHHHHHHDSSHQNGAKAVNHSSKSASVGGHSSAKQSNQALKNAGIRPSLATNLKSTSRPRLVRPMARFRHLLRLFGRKRQSPSRNENASPGNVCRREALPSNKVNVKANQVRPLTVSEEQQQHQHRHYQQPNECRSILPTSAIRGDDRDSDDNEIVYNNIQVPALPPPTRHKICSPSELEDLTKSLSFVQQPSNAVYQQPSTSTSNGKQPQHRFAGNSSNSRRRRKNLLRTRSPTLSPIHESGYSNPTSPPSTPRSTNSQSAHNTTSSSA